MRNNKTFLYIIIFLVAIGLLSKISSNPLGYLIPIVVFGVVFFLYKFPPNLQRIRRRKMPSSTRNNESKKRTTKFRVIEGNKKDDDDEEKPPPYH